MTAHGTLYGLGGRSSRMGQDKSRLNWCCKPLYLHRVSLLARAGIDQVLISGSGFAGFNLPVMLPVNSELRQAVESSIASDNPKDYALWRLHQLLYH
ncbi:NTP transferase domain-containing protein [Endozoicomonas sp. YOMI1]|uniref:NTP transferase domain-containing protein n=1 Tax=Endozoicomonas sp. YOMI1 TaxID=2828739 RepID=UPI002147D4E7|nr:NTP transferase domain-containing protein [Endozoicomonas sp. YOMI1]